MKSQSQLSAQKPIIFAYKFFDLLLGPIHSMFHHCGSLDLWTFTRSVIFFFIYLFIFVKGTLMQIWKSPYMFVFKQNKYPENFTFSILGIIELYSCKVCEMLFTNMQKQ